MTNQFTLIGAPSSAGAFAPGQEKAPAVLRQIGLLDDLAAVGLAVEDAGDLPGFRYRNDPSNPRARNVQAVADNARRVADAVAGVLETNRKFIVLGGDCTNGAGAIAGATRDNSIRTGVIYFDMHGDLNTPQATTAGSLDWTGVAHLLGAEGTEPAFANFDGRSPVLHNDQIVLLGWDYIGSNSDFEREAIIRRKIEVVFLDEVMADPQAAAQKAIAALGPMERIVVHFDVDVIDFTDCPIAENYRHGEGCTLDQAMAALKILAADDRFAGVTISELNPDHAEADHASVIRFAKGLAGALAG